MAKEELVEELETKEESVPKFEKIVVELDPTPFEQFSFKGQTIKMEPFIGLGDKYILLNEYIETLFKEEDLLSGYVKAEYSLILGIIDLCTNISIENLNIDFVFSNGLWEQIKKKLINYDELRSDIDYLVMQENQNRSFGSVLDKLAKKLESVLDQVSGMDLSQEGIATLLSQFNNMIADADAKYTMKPKAPRKKKTE